MSERCDTAQTPPWYRTLRCHTCYHCVIRQLFCRQIFLHKEAAALGRHTVNRAVHKDGSPKCPLYMCITCAMHQACTEFSCTEITPKSTSVSQRVPQETCIRTAHVFQSVHTCTVQTARQHLMYTSTQDHSMYVHTGSAESHSSTQNMQFLSELSRITSAIHGCRMQQVCPPAEPCYQTL